MKLRIAAVCAMLAAPLLISPASAAIVSGSVIHYDVGDATSYSSGTPGSLNDISGSGFTATLTGPPAFAGNNGGFLSFSGTGQYGTLGNVATNFSAGFAATFYANFGTAENWERIIDFGTGQANNNIVIARSGLTSDMNLSIYNGATQAGYCVATGIIQSGWAHYAVVANGTDCYFYRNGSLWSNTTRYDGSGNVISALTAIPANVTRTSNFIGKSNWTNDSLFKGAIGELSIYNRGLTATEVYLNFQSEIFSCVRTTIQSGNTRYVKFYGSNGCMYALPDGVTSIDYLLVAGGGGGGGATNSASLGGGGGGAGGTVIQATSVAVTANTVINIAVGLGGAGGAAGAAGSNGTESSIQINGGTWIQATGGTGGGQGTGTSNVDTLSGDGGGNASYSGGASVWDGGGGGAGAGGNGVAGTDIGGQGGNGGAGGIGVTSAISNDPSQYYGGGGGGGGTPSNNNQPSAQTDGFGGLGGSSVGGKGGVVSATKASAPSATNGALDTGSGGGGGGWNYNFTAAQKKGGDGANGIVIIKYTLAQVSISSIAVTSSSGADQVYRSNETITVAITFSQKVYVLGTPRIPIQGLSSKFLTYSSGSDSTTVIFTYTPSVSDLDLDGFAINANTLELNGGAIQDVSAADAAITHSAIAALVANAIDGRLNADVTISIAANLVFRKASAVTATITQNGKVTFFLDGKRIAKCLKVQATLSSTVYNAVCNLTPSVRGNRTLRIDFYQVGSNSVFTTKSQQVFITNRTGNR